jgi:hypothetical protein
MNISAILRSLLVLILLSDIAEAKDSTRTDAAFEKIVATHWKQTLAANPFLAASLGDKKSANELPNVSLANQVKLASDSAHIRPT